MILLLTISFADFYCLYSWKRSTGAWNVSQSMHFWFFLQEWKVCKESYCWIEIIFSIEDCIVLLSISIAHTKRVKSIIRIALHEKYPYSELFWSVFSCIWTEYREILCIPPYSVQMRENPDQNISEYGHFLRGVVCI